MSRTRPNARAVALASMACAACMADAVAAQLPGSSAPAAPAQSASAPAHAPSASEPAQPQPASVPALPRAVFVWKTDGFGQVIGESIACAPLPARIRSVVPSDRLPSPLSATEGSSSLRIAGTTSGGISREIAVLRWAGPVVMWQRMPVPAAAFEQSLKGLAKWMMTHSFTVTLEDGSALQLWPEPQSLVVELDGKGRSSATVAIHGVPKGMRLVVPKATPMPANGAMGAGPFLIEIDSSDTRVRLATYPDTLLDIEVNDVPAEVRVNTVTPSGLRIERVSDQLAMNGELLKGAPPEQRGILDAERAALEATLEELRKAAAGERIRPTAEPVVACLVDSATGREYATVSITIRDGAGAADAARGQRPGSPEGSGSTSARGAW